MTKKIKKWDVLSFEYNEDSKGVLYMYLENNIIGFEDIGNFCKVYFNNITRTDVNTVIKNKTSITLWDWSEIEEENWMENCSNFFQPILIKDQIYIITPWQPEDDKYINIKINPALAFGTGHHSTTNLMMNAMLDLKLENQSVVDIGTGSGILSILAHRLKSKSIYSLDNDPLIVDNFVENIKLNNMNNQIRPNIEDCLNITYSDFDVILANINKNIILELLPKFLNTNATIVISGILEIDEHDILKKCYLNKYNLLNKYVDREWICLVLK